ncbi:hypothetical protein DFP72DRAFT_859854 [Ephemerocybe angulata]|uniref:Uncharacterized protein n=1 Tax=Ephemerocybe angulata TaxID=980116 RepID=A0A8H6H9C4_9AGAR|nr:hypothetical protein DFP72DRAFT_859854 [Tulosesus angulatus]
MGKTKTRQGFGCLRMNGCEGNVFGRGEEENVLMGTHFTSRALHAHSAESLCRDFGRFEFHSLDIVLTEARSTSVLCTTLYTRNTPNHHLLAPFIAFNEFQRRNSELSPSVMTAVKPCDTSPCKKRKVLFTRWDKLPLSASPHSDWDRRAVDLSFKGGLDDQIGASYEIDSAHRLSINVARRRFRVREGLRRAGYGENTVGLHFGLFTLCLAYSTSRYVRKRSRGMRYVLTLNFSRLGLADDD